MFTQFPHGPLLKSHRVQIYRRNTHPISEKHFRGDLSHRIRRDGRAGSRIRGAEMLESIETVRRSLPRLLPLFEDFNGNGLTTATPSIVLTRRSIGASNVGNQIPFHPDDLRQIME